MSNGKIQNEVNAVKVTVEDLLNATDEVHKLAPDDRNWEGRLHAMTRLFKGQPRKAMSVEYRLVAMSCLLEDGILPGWATPTSSDGSVQVAQAVWEAAASEPLIVEDPEAYFDKHSFLQRVLSLAEPEGHA